MPETPEQLQLPDMPKADDQSKPKDDTQIDDEKIAKDFKSKVESAKRNRRQFTAEWKRNVELRLGKIASQFTGGVDVEDEIQTEINPDWSLTKTKTANLYSQVPTIQATHENKKYAPAIAPFAKALNYEISEKRANAAAAMKECMADMVNAAGFGVVYIEYVARFEEVMMPAEEMISGPQGPMPVKALPESTLQQLVQAGVIHMTPQQRVVSSKFGMTRISPIDALWPAEFSRSYFDDADWLGYTGRMSWPEAKADLGLTDDLKDKVLSTLENPVQEDLKSSPEQSVRRDAKYVKFDRIFYWRHKVDPDEKHFKCIWEVVWVEGLEKPVLHRHYEGQKYVEETRQYVGVTRLPIQIGSLTYISDNPIPPSDSSAGRPQVNDLRRSRNQMFKNRERSIPIRWFDVNRIDQTVQQSLMRGTWQAIIPVNGDGSRVLGEVARASYPSEDFTFDRQSKADLMETWSISPQQMGVSQPGDRTKAEVQQTQANFATRIGQERAEVASFFLRAVEVLAGLMVLYSDFPTLADDERQAMEQNWDRRHILHDLVLKIRPDSTVMLDTGQRIDRLMKFLNMTAKSGFVNPMPIIVELAELSGLNPAEIIIQPKPKQEEANISLRLNAADLRDPLVAGTLAKKNQLPDPEHMEVARKVLADSQKPVMPSPPPGPPQGPGPQPGAPNWSLADKIAKRSRDMGGV